MKSLLLPSGGSVSHQTARTVDSKFHKTSTTCTKLNAVRKKLQWLKDCNSLPKLALFVRWLLRAGVQPTLDLSIKTVERSSALAQGERRGIGWCVQVYVRHVR